MILVRSLLQRLNGNKQLIWLCCTLLFSCGTARKKPSVPRPPNQEQVQKEIPVKTIPNKIDTIYWKEEVVKQETKPEILKVDSLPKEDKTKVSKAMKPIHVLALIPFKVSEQDTVVNKINTTNLRFVQFYAGMKMALNEFQNKSEVPVFLDVFDSGEIEHTEKILQERVSNTPDLIIGPYKAEALKFAANWAKQNKTMLVSPWISSSTITDQNQYYLQLKPGLNAHFQKINEHARKHFNPENIFLVSKSKVDSRAKYFNEGFAGKDLIQEEIISEEDLSKSIEPILEKYLKADGPTVFILPMASSKDENYIYHFLRRVSAEKKTKPVYIYGLSKWTELKTDIFDFINTLNVRLSISNFTDESRTDIKNFRRKYFDEYREFPGDDALEGYDVAQYLIGALLKSELPFQIENLKQQFKPLETEFEIKPVYKTTNTSQVVPDFYENSFIRIVEIKNNRYNVIE